MLLFFNWLFYWHLELMIIRTIIPSFGAEAYAMLPTINLIHQDFIAAFCEKYCYSDHSMVRTCIHTSRRSEYGYPRAIRGCVLNTCSFNYSTFECRIVPIPALSKSLRFEQQYTFQSKICLWDPWSMATQYSDWYERVIFFCTAAPASALSKSHDCKECNCRPKDISHFSYRTNKN